MSDFVTKYDINGARHLRMQCEAAYFMSYFVTKYDINGKGAASSAPAVSARTH